MTSTASKTDSNKLTFIESHTKTYNSCMLKVYIATFHIYFYMKNPITLRRPEVITMNFDVAIDGKVTRSLYITHILVLCN